MKVIRSMDVLAIAVIIVKFDWALIIVTLVKWNHSGLLELLIQMNWL
jgi:hypothetical protein